MKALDSSVKQNKTVLKTETARENQDGSVVGSSKFSLAEVGYLDPGRKQLGEETQKSELPGTWKGLIRKLKAAEKFETDDQEEKETDSPGLCW